MNNQYQCFGRNLTQACTRKLILELFEEQTVSRKEIVNTVFEEHHKRGGKNSEVRVGLVKSALRSLKKSGFAENVELGYWFIRKKAHHEPQYEPPQPRKTHEEFVDPDLGSVTTIGSGAGSVYLYYYPTYRDFAESKGKTVWPCKIGKSKSANPTIRIDSQTATALPEKPVVGLIILTDSPDEIERKLHKLLHIGNKGMQDALGKEWFMTCPSDVQEFYEILE